MLLLSLSCDLPASVHVTSLLLTKFLLRPHGIIKCLLDVHFQIFPEYYANNFILYGGIRLYGGVIWRMNSYIYIHYSSHIQIFA